MTCCGLVKHKATKAAAKQPENFDIVKSSHLEAISSTVNKYHIPDDLIINWDQTGSALVPSSQWSMAVPGSKQVEVTGLGDKRETKSCSPSP